MLNFVISLFLGAGLDSLYYYLYLSKIKEIRTKRLLFYILIFIGYVLFNMIVRYNLYYYLAFDIYIYFILKYLYKSQINDFFLVIFIDSFYILISIICYFTIGNYIVALVINKIVIFIPIIFKDKLRFLYTNYCKMWNRNRDKNMPIKSLTLRNISLVTLNTLIVILYISLIFIINK